MALIDCPECREKISDKARACPRCGYPLAAERSYSSLREFPFLDPLAEFADVLARSLKETFGSRKEEGPSEKGKDQEGSTGSKEK